MNGGHRAGAARSFAAQLMLVQSAVLLLLALCLGGMGYVFGRQAIEHGALRAVTILAGARAETLRMRVRGVRDRAGTFLQVLDARCARSDAACGRTMLENFVDIQEVSAARIDRAGAVVSVGPEELVRKLESPAEGLVRADDGTHLLVLRAEEGDARITFTIGTDFIDPIFVDSGDVGKAGETFLADGEGYFVTPARYPSEVGRSHPIDVRPMVRCLAGESGAMIAPDYRGMRMVHGFRPVPEVGGCVMAHMDYAEAMAPAHALGRTIAVVTVAGLAMALGVSVWLAGRLGAVLGRLAQRAHALAEGDLDSPVWVEGPAEVQSYARVFAEMASTLRGRIETLDATRRELDAFNASVTHDLRAPLRSIDGFSAVLLEGGGDLPASSIDLLRRIQAAARRMGRIIDDLSALSRISPTELVREPVDVTGMALSIGAELASRSGGTPVTFTVQPGLAVHADPGLLRIALENLLANAWKFSGKVAEPRVEVFGEQGPEGTVIAVRDNGVGFDSAQAGRLFQPFTRLHSAAEYEGTGLGLATVARIVRRHGGRVWACGNPGEGATFYVALPSGSATGG